MSSTVEHAHECCGPGYASPEVAMRAEPEKLLYAIALYTGTGIQAPDYLATIDLDPASSTYSQVIHRLPMPYIGDELHHFGWNACSSCHDNTEKSRRFLVIPGIRSSRIYIVDTIEPKAPKIHKVLEPDAIKAATNLTAPHTVHCLANGQVMVSMLGDGDGNAPGGFLLLDESFEILGRWEQDASAMQFNYDFWYQPRHNVMVSSEWGAPKTFYPGFDLNDVTAGNYGHHLHFWDWEKRSITESIDLGDQGLIPLEVRFHHDPDSTHGYVGAALSSNIWHWSKPNGHWQVDKVVDVPSVDLEGFPIPVPSLITDLLISLAIEAAGLRLPVGCRYGACITCAARLISGTVEQPRAIALKPEQAEQGYVLLCIAYARTDCQFEVGIESQQALYPNPFKAKPM